MNLQQRAIAILTSPKTEWPVIAGEPDDVASLYRNYIVVLAAIPAVAIVLGLVVIGLPLVGRLSVGSAVSAGLSTYVTSLAAPIVAAVVIAWLGPRFQSSDDTTQALKLVAYASTPVWVAGVLNLVLALSPLAIIAALYAIYLFYLGVPVIMKTPLEKVVPFMVVSALAIIVINIVLSFLVTALGMTRYGV